MAGGAGCEHTRPIMFTNRDAVIELVRERVADETFQHYLDWRDELSSCASAYALWAAAAASERELAFAAYTAALDREQQAARRPVRRSRQLAPLRAVTHINRGTPEGAQRHGHGHTEHDRDDS